MIQVILFDLGGVIFTDFFSGAEQDLSQKLGIDSQKVLEVYRKTDIAAYCKNELSDEDRWKSFLKQLNISQTKIPLCIDEFYKSYKLFPQSLKMVQTVKHQTTCRLGVLSDQPMGIATYLQNKYKDIFDCFEKNITIISAEVGFSKKDKDFSIYTLAIEKAHALPEEILFIDDSQQNLEMAQKKGIKTFLYNALSFNLETLLEKIRSS